MSEEAAVWRALTGCDPAPEQLENMRKFYASADEFQALQHRAVLRAGHFQNFVLLMQAHGLLLGRVGHIDSVDHCNCDVAAQYRLHREQYEALGTQ